MRPINIVAETNPQLIKRLLPVTARVEVGTTGSGDRVATVDAGVGELLAVIPARAASTAELTTHG